VAARNLHHVRREIGDKLVDQVEQITRDFNAETDTVCSATLPGDGRRLRGIPAIGGVGGCITDAVVPGSDEHLDMMDDLNERVA
jgi:hypothetical protein